LSQAKHSETYFYLRRLHSLTGVLPIGGFLLDHFFTNAYSWNHQVFNEHVRALNQIPGVQLLEWGVIVLPILFHGLLGLWMATQMDANQLEYGNFRNWMYLFQRLSGVIVFAFIAFHLFHFRIGHEADFKNTADPGYDPYRTIKSGLELSPWITALYAIGVVAASFHFANGSGASRSRGGSRSGAARRCS
jgi:succinate dehydrogenase / fumarate reductase cytochrome b subunit